MSAPTPPKGSLEDLFRHHLLESGAAVPPRPQVWEQLDNSLLLAQNEQYRRRLRAYRWAVAASLLLTGLAGTGWWHSQQQQAATLPLAQATANEAAARSGAGAAAGPAAAPSRAARRVASTPISPSIAQPATLSTSSLPLASAALPAAPRRASRPHLVRQAATLAAARPGYVLAGGGQPAALTSSEAPPMQQGSSVGLATTTAHPAADGSGAATSPPVGLMPTHEAAGATEAVAATAGKAPASLAAGNSASARLPALAAVAGQQPADSGVGTTQLATNAPTVWSASPAVLAELNEQHNPELLGPPTAEELRMGRDVAVAVDNGPALPAGLRAPAAGAGLPLMAASRWQVGASYTASAFQPNIDFLKPLNDYDPVLGATSAYFTQVASTEYRDHLRAGLSQRLTLWASRRLGAGHWSLRLGAEASHSEAHSASSVDFVGEQVYSFAYRPTTPQLRATSYGYDMVSLPVELRRGNSLRTGWSLYGRLGGALSALFNVRSDVAGSPEASRNYTLTTDNSPYRRMTASVRGGLGVQLRPAGHQWTFSLGPVAETGVFSLNANPGQNFWHQQRPYSVGLEAGVELGGVPHLLPR